MIKLEQKILVGYLLENLDKEFEKKNFARAKKFFLLINMFVTEIYEWPD